MQVVATIFATLVLHFYPVNTAISNEKGFLILYFKKPFNLCGLFIYFFEPTPNFKPEDSCIFWNNRKERIYLFDNGVSFAFVGVLIDGKYRFGLPG